MAGHVSRPLLPSMLVAERPSQSPRLALAQFRAAQLGLQPVPRDSVNDAAGLPLAIGHGTQRRWHWLLFLSQCQKLCHYSRGKWVAYPKTLAGPGCGRATAGQG
jgi:hypothetical protein